MRPRQRDEIPAKSGAPGQRRSARSRTHGAAPPAPDSGAGLSDEEIHRLIAEAAYLRAQARGFAPGHELEDWLEAEKEIMMRLGASPA